MSPTDRPAVPLAGAHQSLQVGALRVVIEGSGPRLLLLHGWPDTHALWDDTVAALRGRYQCARCDLPGYGDGASSQAPDFESVMAQLEAVLDALPGDGPVSLVVHDWGAVFGYQLAARRPGQIARVVGLDVGDTFSKAFLASLSAKARLGVMAYQGWLALAWCLGRWGGTWMTRKMAAWLRCPANPLPMNWRMNYPYWMAWTGGFRGARNWQPDVPTLYLFGARKPFMFHSARWLEAVRATPGGEVHEMPTGHWLMVSGRERYLALVQAWLSRTDRAG